MQPPRRGLSAAVQGLTDMQRDFVKHLASGKDSTRSAQLAGYGGGKDGGGYGVAGWRLANDPRIIAAVEAEFERILRTELVPLSLAAFRRGLSPDAPLMTQVKTGEAVLRYYKVVGGGVERESDALSEAELEATIARLKEHAAALDAKAPLMIDATPNPEQGSGGLFD